MKKIRIELGVNLSGLISVKSDKSQNLQRQIVIMRERMMKRYGVVLGKVELALSHMIDPEQYRLLLDGEEVAFGEVVPDKLMAIAPSHNSVELKGEVRREPVFGKEVVWISPKKSRKIADRGFTLLQDVEVIDRHVSDYLESNLARFIDADDIQAILDSLPEKYASGLVKSLLGKLSLEQIAEVYRLLIEEKVSLKNTLTVMQAIDEAAIASTESQLIVEHVRACLANQILACLKDRSGGLSSITLSNEWENIFGQVAQLEEEGIRSSMQNEQVLVFLETLRKVREHANSVGENPVLLTRASTRRFVRQATREYQEDIVVLGQNEIPAEIPLRNLGFV